MGSHPSPPSDQLNPPRDLPHPINTTSYTTSSPPTATPTSTFRPPPYPPPPDLNPNLPLPSSNPLTTLIPHILDYQITHSSLLKLTLTCTASSILSRPIPTTIHPTLFPRQCFEQALALQQSYNSLYMAVACDESWLASTLKDLRDKDEFVRVLWGVWETVKAERRKVEEDEEQGGNGRAWQDIEMGIFRSDYMLHLARDNHSWQDAAAGELGEAGITACAIKADPQLKQVEMNTFSCAGGTHSNIVSNMHRHLAKTGAYDTLATVANIPNIAVDPKNLPLNNTIASLAAALARGHAAYGGSKCKSKSVDVTSTCVLFIVQPENVNICDERPLEYALWEMEPAVPAFRVEFGEEVLQKTRLTVDGELVYQAEAGGKFWEVAVVYMRAGYDPAEYTETGIACRVQLERSMAIKCPGILTHLCTLKKVQQSLTGESALNRFLPSKQADEISATFASILPLDNSSSGMKAGELALNPETSVGYVLKPSVEGGGHNIYGGDIPDFLESIPMDEWSKYVLMEMLEPPEDVYNILMSPSGLFDGEVVSELGIFGACMWQQDKSGQCQVVENVGAGWSFKTKISDVNEMSVIKGYGAFDSPHLVDMKAFKELTRISLLCGQSD